MRTLKYALLGLISRRPLSGYDLAREFDKELANFWHAEHSQIYPELRKLTEEGLITYTVELAGEKLEKKVYSITDEGKRAMQDWLKCVEPLQPTPKDVFRLRLYFADQQDPETLLMLIREESAMHQEKLAKLSDSLSAYDGCPRLGEAAFGDYLVLEQGVRREQYYLRWLQFCREKITGQLQQD